MPTVAMDAIFLYRDAAPLAFFSLPLYFSSTREAIVGVIIRDIRKEAEMANRIVSGKDLSMRPIMPGVSAKGIKAETVVSVAARTAGATWFIAIFAASFLSSHSL